MIGRGSLRSMRQVERVRIGPTGIGAVGQVADAIQEVCGLACHQHDRSGWLEPHDFIGGEQGPDLDMLAEAARHAARLGDAPVRGGRPSCLKADGLLPQSARDTGRCRSRGHEKLLRRIGQKALSNGGIHRLELWRGLGRTPRFGRRNPAAR